MSIDIKVEYDPATHLCTAYVNGVEGLLNATDVAYLIQKAKDLPPGSKYVETGSYLGCSAILVALHAKDPMVYCHDIWAENAEYKNYESINVIPDKEEQYLYTFYKNVLDNNLERVIIPMRGDSKYTLKIHKDESIDFAFLDGDHSREGVLADISVIWPKIKPGGRVAFHDKGMESVERGMRDFLCNISEVDHIYDIKNSNIVEFVKNV
jgi:predicted O-methyltransferase YrrM